jgi:hypothetical protein
MRKLIVAALLFTALACFVGANLAYAGDCGSCKTKCHSCKPKCEPCKAKCEPCKPKCNSCGETKCHSCKPKCDPCGETKCHSCKPKCSPCADKCGGCNKCGGCKSKCGGCEMKSKCGGCGFEDPYAACATWSSNLCAGNCGDNTGVCKRSCVTCETVCRRVVTVDPCTGCTTVNYVTETVYHEIERPRVIPWWFNEKGAGNIYPDMQQDKKDEGAEKE